MGVRYYPGIENPPRRKIVCKKCRKEKTYHAKGMCSGCYMSIRNKKRAEINNVIF